MCPTTPSVLFYSECIFQKTLEHTNESIKINGESLSNIRCADDIAVLADSGQDLDLLLNRPTREDNDLVLKVNTTKTKVMVISRNAKRILLSMGNPLNTLC